MQCVWGVMNEARKRANREIRIVLEHAWDIYLPHPAIRAERDQLYRADGVHLSDVGLDIFLADLQ